MTAEEIANKYINNITEGNLTSRRQLIDGIEAYNTQVLNDIKKEIEKEEIHEHGLDAEIDNYNDGLNKAISIIDKHITESHE